MAVTEKETITIEELLSNVNRHKAVKNEEKAVKKVKGTQVLSKNFPVGMILFVLLIAALGIMVIMLKNEVVLLKTEMADLKHIKTQITESEHKIKIAVIENKLEESEKEKQALKDQIAQIKSEVEELKNIKINSKRPAKR